MRREKREALLGDGAFWNIAGLKKAKISGGAGK